MTGNGKAPRRKALVRHLRGNRFDGRMRGLLTTADPLVRSRAQFLLHIAADPDLTIKRTTWARWLAGGGTT